MTPEELYQHITTNYGTSPERLELLRLSWQLLQIRSGFQICMDLEGEGEAWLGSALHTKEIQIIATPDSYGICLDRFDDRWAFCYQEPYERRGVSPWYDESLIPEMIQHLRTELILDQLAEI